METLVFFVAIAAIQVIASYVKQKKDKAEAAKKVQQRASQPAQSSTPHRTAPPPPVAQTPDPLKEIMRQLGVPEVHAPPPPPEAPARKAEVVLEKASTDEVKERAARHFEEPKAHKVASKPKSTPKPTAVDPVAAAATAAVHTGDLGLSIEDTARFEAAARARSGAQDLPKAADLRKGIVWATILQEPRFRKPWSPAYR